MKPPGTSLLPQPFPGAGPRSSSRLPAPRPRSCHLFLLALLLFCPGCPRAVAATALHWNETAGDIERTPEDEDAAFQQSNSSSSKNNSHSSAFEKEITLPSRLVYYLNRDYESPYHILDTRSRHQRKHNKAYFPGKVETCIRSDKLYYNKRPLSLPKEGHSCHKICQQGNSGLTAGFGCRKHRCYV